MAHASLQIRPIHEGDFDRWRELWNGYLAFYETTLDAEITNLTWNRILDSSHAFRCFVALYGDRIIGFAHCFIRPSTWSKNGYCYLEDLFVDPQNRGVGAGRALIDAVISYARSEKAGRVYWTTKENNLTARKLYDSYLPKSEFVQYRLPQIYEQ